ncbi:hypothetical protein GQ44DRAFT_171408 [Phaeosphaeriaceae sp. PMI808]|nr:hypothetical protein GQ44DRAFT_171408 [Phaeosphaeriaceae sp. PMI808]
MSTHGIWILAQREGPKSVRPCLSASTKRVMSHWRRTTCIVDEEGSPSFHHPSPKICVNRANFINMRGHTGHRERHTHPQPQSLPHASIPPFNPIPLIPSLTCRVATVTKILSPARVWPGMFVIKRPHENFKSLSRYFVRSSHAASSASACSRDLCSGSRISYTNFAHDSPFHLG